MADEIQPGDEAPESRGNTERQHAYLREEMQHAYRAILMTPLMRNDHEKFPALRRHAKVLQELIRRETGWHLKVTPSGARLAKIPADLGDGTRGLPDFNRRRYAILCLTCVVLTGARSQITLQILGEKLVLAAADPAFVSRGFSLTLTSRAERHDLVVVCRTLLNLGVLQRVEGDEEGYVNEQSTDVLYDINRWLLNEMMIAVKGPSTGLDRVSITERVHHMADEVVFDNEEARRTAMRHNLARRLLDDPVVYFAELGMEALVYFSNQRGPMSARLCEATGMSVEQRAEGTALVDEPGEMSDVRMRGDGTDGHVTLLVAEYLSQKHFRSRKHDGGGANGYTEDVEIAEFIRRCVPSHGTLWRKEAKMPGAEYPLAAQALEKLAKQKLITRQGTQIFPLPAIARFALGTPKISKPFRTRTM